MTAYYNEIDPFAAQWLRNLVAAGHIAPGDVDERSISDVRPSDLVGYTQCHFFAGIGVWSYALRRAGWPDDRPIWTGSCPCQPFSAAGKGDGFADERHLWPHWDWLIRECKPAGIFGEQVASKDAEPWIDLVQDDLEALGYAFGCVPFPAAGIGAPHIRDRNYWVADACSPGRVSGALRSLHRGEDGAGPRDGEPERSSSDGWLEHSFGEGLEGQRSGYPTARGQWEGSLRPAAAASEFVGLAHHHHHGQSATPVTGLHDAEHHAESRGGAERRTSPTNGIWGTADWLFCRDGKWRPVEPGTFPLAHGAASRVGRLRAYGNAIVSEAARHFIEVYLEHERAALDLGGSLIGHNGPPIDDFAELLS